MKKTALELMKKYARETVVKLAQTELPARPSGGYNGNIPAHKFPSDTVVLTKFAKYNADNVYMYYFDPDKKYIQNVVVPNGFIIEAAPKNEETKKLFAKYRKHIISNLESHLHHEFTVGADPEIFVENKKGEIIPAFEFLGSKEKPTKSETQQQNFYNKVYWDGFQAEFDVLAGSCAAFTIDSIQNGLRGVLDAARKHDKKAKLSAKTVFDIPVEMLQEAKPEHVAFGCMPSLNAYDMKGLDAPGQEVPYRAAGGHIHIGVKGWKKSTIERSVKALDAILGVACVSMFAKFDDPRRRQMYGLAGEYRTPKHGFEYRVLSNAWTFHPLTANIVYDLARPAIMIGFRDLLDSWKATQEETIKCINDCNVELARTILKRNKSILLKILSTKQPGRARFMYDIILKGVDRVLRDPTDIEGNWHLSNDKWVGHCNAPGKNIVGAFSMFDKGEKIE